MIRSRGVALVDIEGIGCGMGTTKVNGSKKGGEVKMVESKNKEE